MSFILTEHWMQPPDVEMKLPAGLKILCFHATFVTYRECKHFLFCKTEILSITVDYKVQKCI